MAVARHAAGAPASGGARGTVVAALVMVVMLLLTVATVRYFIGGFDAPAVEPVRESVVYPPEPRPTPYWRFRDEWLTPQPRR